MVVVGTSILIFPLVMGTILTTTPGINLFMSLYGLTVFLETPEPQRKGRKRYIVASFMITVLFSLGASLDMADYLQSLFKSTSTPDWKYFVSYTAAGLFIAVGDALLVRVVPGAAWFASVWQHSQNICRRCIAVMSFAWNIGG
jgi:hypothetical protein